MALSALKRTRLLKLVAIGTGTLAFVSTVAGLYLSRVDIPVLQPAGPIAAGQKQLLVVSFLLMLIVVVPVFILLFSFAWRYREANSKARYQPDWDHSRTFETVWWLIPGALITVLAVITWVSTHELDPYKPIASPTKPLTVQVVALNWRWLFIYPEQRVASLNYLRLPEKTPVQFQITADAPMNSFWIPQLGGQVYAMPGMNTYLHLQADKTGKFYGLSSNLSGKGFSGMNFTAEATSAADFTAWVGQAARSEPLSRTTYREISKPSTVQSPYYFSRPEPGLYDTIIHKYMNSDHAPAPQNNTENPQPTEHAHSEGV